MERVSSLDPHREVGILPIDPPTPFYRFVPASSPVGRVLVIHGLDASKELMQVFCAALTDAGFEVYAIDLPGHGDSPVGFNPIQARDVVARTLDYLGESMPSSGILSAPVCCWIANERKMPRMVLLSPPRPH
jgi:pimeloyl-ACP methyl ester carboxylesterase